MQLGSSAIILLTFQPGPSKETHEEPLERRKEEDEARRFCLVLSRNQRDNLQEDLVLSRNTRAGGK